MVLLFSGPRLIYLPAVFAEMHQTIQQFEVVIPPESGMSYKKNNPFNLRLSGEFVIYKTPRAGWDAGISDIALKLHGDSTTIIPDGPHRGTRLSASSTLEDLMRVYAPNTDGNNVPLYVNWLAAQMGVTATTTLAVLNPATLAPLIAYYETGTTIRYTQP